MTRLTADGEGVSEGIGGVASLTAGTSFHLAEGTWLESGAVPFLRTQPIPPLLVTLLALFGWRVREGRNALLPSRRV
jgi:hypothetical protein